MYSKLFVFLCLFINVHFVHSQEEDFNIGTLHTIPSEILGEERSYWVSLPASYAGDNFYIDKSYPIAILLDGERLFHLVSGMIQNMSSGGIEQIPEMILIGVNNTDRNRDFFPIHTEDQSTDTGREDPNRFRQFLTDELIPEIVRQYRSNSCKILIGHSLGGLFAIDSFLEESIFNGYLAIDPSLWWENERLNDRAKTILAAKKNHNASVYISQANNPFNEGLTTGRLGKAIQGFKGVIEKTDREDLRYNFDFFENEDHFSVPLISLYQGLQFLFDGYKYPLNQISGKSAEDIRKHYQELSHRLGGELSPPGKLLNQVGLFLLRSEGQLEEATQILEMNKENYPNSAIPYHSLGDAYRLQEKPDLAIRNYQKALELNPLNEEAKRRIAELKNG